MPVQPLARDSDTAIGPKTKKPLRTVWIGEVIENIISVAPLWLAEFKMARGISIVNICSLTIAPTP
jgi:hypothetical protein